jgi:hypothetical protein
MFIGLNLLKKYEYKYLKCFDHNLPLFEDNFSKGVNNTTYRDNRVRLLQINKNTFI